MDSNNSPQYSPLSLTRRKVNARLARMIFIIKRSRARQMEKNYARKVATRRVLDKYVESDPMAKTFERAAMSAVQYAEEKIEWEF